MNIVPETLRLAKDGKTLTVVFSGKDYPLSAEYLRVFSPSAEVRGHGNTDGITVVAGKKTVMLRHILPVGNYAVRLIFSDGHHSGIYSWETLYELALNRQVYWQQYLHTLEKTGKSREKS